MIFSIVYEAAVCKLDGKKIIFNLPMCQALNTLKYRQFQFATYVPKVLLYEAVCSLVHHIVVMILQHFNAVQSS